MRRLRDLPDTGSAIIIVMMALGVLTALGTALTAVTISNMQGTGRAAQAGNALNLSDAALRQAVSYLRNEGVRGLTCSPTCTTNPWGNSTTPAKVTLNPSTGQAFTAWIEPIAPYPANNPGQYRVHATGIAGGGPARRVVTADIQVIPYNVPKGVYAKTVVAGGAAQVLKQSLFTTGCVYNRSKIRFQGIDIAYGIPAAVHSSQIITDSNGSGQYCPGTNKPIHDPTLPAAAKNCNVDYPYDQDRQGGPLAGTSCLGTAGAYPQTSYIASDQELFDTYNLSSGGLTQAQQNALKTVAVSQGNYYTTATGWTSPARPNSVLYFDLSSAPANQRVIDLNDIVGFERDPAATDISHTDNRCQPRSLVIVIVAGNAKLNSNTILTASVFLTSDDPYGYVQKSNGNTQFVGTLYSNNLDLTGTANLQLDQCFLANPPPALFDFKASAYTEYDR
jgi:hypothetical protein